MSALDTIRSWFRQTKIVTSDKLHELLTPPVSSGMPVNHDSMMRLSSVYAAVTTIADSIGTLSTHLYQDDEQGRRRATTSPLYNILRNQPNNLYNASDFKAIMQSHVLIYGNAFAVIHKGENGSVKALEIIHPSDVTVSIHGRGVEAEKRYTIRGHGYNRDLYDYEILHIMNYSKDGLIGMPQLDIMRENIGGQLAVEQFGTSFFGNGATVGGVLKMKGRIPGRDKEERQEWVKKAREQFDAMASGVENMHKIMFLEDDSEFERLTFPPEQIQFIESRRFGVEDVARYFKVPGHMLGIQDGAKYNNVEHANLWFYKHTLLPHITKWEQELNNKLLSERQRGRMYFKFNVHSLLRGDMKSQVEYLEKRVNMQSMTPNEVRAYFEENPIERGDQVLVPKNYWHPSEVIENE